MSVSLSLLLLIVFYTSADRKAYWTGGLHLMLNRQRLDDVLSIISNKAGFSFSYNSNIVKRDSLVSLTINNRTVRQVLNQLFNGNYEYKESGNYVILRRVSLQLTTVTKTDTCK